jgi:hypothetical protein
MSSPTVLVAVATSSYPYDEATIYTSVDGANWVETGAGVFAYSSYYSGGVDWSPARGLFVVASGNGEVTTSTNGTTWSPISWVTGGSNVRVVIWAASLSKFVITGFGGTFWTSPDASTWTTVAPEAWLNGSQLAWLPAFELFICATGDSSGFATSGDLSNWTSYTVATNYYTFAYAASDDAIVVVGSDPDNHGAVWNSTDGTTWSSAGVITEAGWLSAVTWSPDLDLFVAVSAAGDILSNPSGDTGDWTVRHNTGGLLSAVTWSPGLGLFVVGGDAGVTLTSPDGIDWTEAAAIGTPLSLTGVASGPAATFGPSPINVRSSSRSHGILFNKAPITVGSSSRSHGILFNKAPITVGSTSESAQPGILTAYDGEPHDILAPVVLTGRISADLPAPVPPVDSDGIADPTEAPAVVSSDTDAGHLPAGTYQYAYAGWVGDMGQATGSSPWSEPITLTTEDTITATYPTLPGADGYLLYRREGSESVGAVSVTFVVVGSQVTSVDTGTPVGTYPADGSQTDGDNAPFPVGTPIINDRDGHPQPAGSNASHGPTITVNSTATWAVAPTTLRRESLIFNRPTAFGRFHQPVGWLPADVVSAPWGQVQVIIDGKDVTYFRAHPMEVRQWSSNEPNGDAACEIHFPQISWFERPGEHDLGWLEGGSDVDMVLHRPGGTRKTLFEGLVVGVGLDGQGAGVKVDVLGTLYQADHTPYVQELYKRNRDIGTAIKYIMDGTISRHFLPCNAPVTGIRTNTRGSGGPRLTQGVQDLLATAFTSDATNQWTITNDPGRRPVVRLKDKSTRHWSMAMGHPGLTLSIADDFQQLVGVVFGSGVALDGGAWYNAKYPGVRVDDAPLFPLPVGEVFMAGDSHHGFDAMADQLRSYGYSMLSGDTYAAADEGHIRDAQRSHGITIDGIVGAQTWTALFGVGGSTPSLDGAHIAPLAAVPWNVALLERLDGSIIGPNPKYDRSKLAIGRLEEYGEGVSKAEGLVFARGEIQAALRHDPMWVGSATLSMDPENGSRWEMRAGQNLFVKFAYPAPVRRGVDDGLLLHISQATVTLGGDVALELSYLGHDMTTLAAIVKRNKDNLDPARRGPGSQHRTSRISKDAVIPWDAEAGGGKVPLHNLQGNFWTVVRIPAGQIGSIVSTRYICSTAAWYDTLEKAFKVEAGLSGAKEFCIAVFDMPVTANFLRDTVGNPLTNARVWTERAARLEKAGLIQAYGASDQPAGYWPGAGSEGDPLTGKLFDGSAWEWQSAQPPYLWVAEFCTQSTRVAGQFRNAPLGG